MTYQDDFIEDITNPSWSLIIRVACWALVGLLVYEVRERMLERKHQRQMRREIEKHESKKADAERVYSGADANGSGEHGQDS